MGAAEASRARARIGGDRKGGPRTLCAYLLVCSFARAGLQEMWALSKVLGPRVPNLCRAPRRENAQKRHSQTLQTQVSLLGVRDYRSFAPLQMDSRAGGHTQDAPALRSRDNIRQLLGSWSGWSRVQQSRKKVPSFGRCGRPVDSLPSLGSKSLE